MCEDLRHRSIDDRNRFVWEHGLCFGCLHKGHVARVCNVRRTCSICKGRHPTSLHRDWRQSVGQGPVPVEGNGEHNRETREET